MGQVDRLMTKISRSRILENLTTPSLSGRHYVTNVYQTGKRISGRLALDRLLTRPTRRSTMEAPLPPRTLNDPGVQSWRTAQAADSIQPNPRPASHPSAGGAAVKGMLRGQPIPFASRRDRPAPPLLLSGRFLTPQEVTVIGCLYFPYLELQHLLAISERESGLFTAAWNWDPPVEDSRGITQINVLAWTDPGEWNLFDPQIALYWSGWIFDREGWEPWRADGPHPFPWA